MKEYTIVRTKKKILARKVTICASIFSRTLGLMFHPKLNGGEGIMLVANKESKAQSSIHSFFVFFPFDALWLNEEKILVDKRTVQPFRAFISPKFSAKYVLELSKGMGEGLSIGEKIEF